MTTDYSVRHFVRRRWQRWLDKRIPRRHEVTLDRNRIFIFLSPQGGIMAAVLVALFVAGLNYANNLLLGLCFFLGGLLVITIHHTYANLSGLRIVALGTEPAFSGEKAGFRVRLESTTGRQYERLALTWADAETVVDLVAEPTEIGLYLKSGPRGLFRPPRLRLQTVYPLGLLRAWTWVDLDLAAVIYPVPIESTALPTGSGEDDEGEVQRVTGTEDFEGLRQYVPGDPLAHISWRHMARAQGLLTKRYADELAGSDMLDWDYFTGMDVEGRLSRLAWWVDDLSRQGRAYGLRLPGQEIAIAQGTVHRGRCLEALALYEWRP